MRKGFTLMELLAVIGLLSALSTVSFYNVNKISEQRKQKELNILINNVEENANFYIINNDEIRTKLLNKEETTECTTLETLQNEGLLEQTIINPVTNEQIPSSTCVNSKLDESGKIISTFVIE